MLPYHKGNHLYRVKSQDLSMKGKEETGMKTRNNVELVDKSFKIMLFFKLAFAAGESIAGVLLYFFKNETIQTFIAFLTSGEIAKNPNAFIASHLVQLGQLITVSGQRLAAIYLLLHGVLKLLTLFLLLRRKLWAYPLSILVFVGFIIYQLREFMANHHYSMIALTFFDLILILLTYLEYKNLKGNSRFC